MFGMAMPTAVAGTTAGGSNSAGARALARVRRGFSLIELVIVVVIIGIIAAIAVPRMSRGSQGAGESALKGSLTVLRNAIDLYQTEHQAYPCTGGTYTSAADFERELTKYTDGNGASNGGGTKDSAHPYGPYLRRIPPMPVGSKKGQSTIKMAASDTEAPGTTGEAWIYYPTTGELKANLAATELDSNDQPYSGY